jgi:hypothetical protein
MHQYPYCYTSPGVYQRDNDSVRRYLGIAVLYILILAALPAQARMYQWVDPGTGTPQLSGKPPAWYRSPAGGARVLVFERGRLIDDTAIAVSEPEREFLRQAAFHPETAGQETARSAPQEAGQQEAAQPALPEEPLPEEQLPRAATDAERETQAPAVDRALQEQYERMRALVSEWEKLQTELARSAIENPPERTPPAENQAPPATPPPPGL